MRKHYISFLAAKELLNGVLVTVSLVGISVFYLFFFQLTRKEQERLRLTLICRSCESAKALATADFKKGQYKLIRWGLGDSSSVNLDDAFERDYGIFMIRGGCVPYEKLNCYKPANAPIFGS